MKLSRPYSLAEMAEFLKCEFSGPPDHQITGINEIHVVEPGDIVFVDHPKYYDKALESAATTILINKSVEVPRGKGLLISDDPFRDFNTITKAFMPFAPSSTSISPTATIGQGTVIQPNAFVGNNVSIGKNCIIHSNVSIYDNTIIGDDVIIHANVVLGADAFYYKKRPEGFDRLISGGRVIIEDKVEIGAGSTIDKGVSGDTTIGYGTKIDNNVQIGHDTRIGKHCLFASQVGIAGCVVIEDHVTLWGQVGVISGITIGTGTVVYAQSGVSTSLPSGKTFFGSPADEARKKYREMASIKVLPEIIEKMQFREE
jgi:UDP-3-O-[3-hydroxymyristoyl] glucosamine N-acyltransferase